MIHLGQLQDEARKLGMNAVHHGNGHWQIRGRVIVNYYPSRGTIYVAGHVHGLKGTIEDCLRFAQGDLPDIKLAQRKQSYKTIRRKMFTKKPHCHWCHKKIAFRDSTVDHVIPLSKGGSNFENNLVLACQECNKRRGNRV